MTTIVKLEKCENFCTIYYKDISYRHINEYKHFTFEDVDNALENLYTMIIEGFNNPPKERIMLELPEHYLYLSFPSELGVYFFQFDVQTKKSNISSYSTKMSKRQVNKLFGK